MLHVCNDRETLMHYSDELLLSQKANLHQQAAAASSDEPTKGCEGEEGLKGEALWREPPQMLLSPQKCPENQRVPRWVHHWHGFQVAAKVSFMFVQAASPRIPNKVLYKTAIRPRWESIDRRLWIRTDKTQINDLPLAECAAQKEA